jgi:hypothetical protein
MLATSPDGVILAPLRLVSSHPRGGHGHPHGDIVFTLIALLDRLFDSPNDFWVDELDVDDPLAI